MNALAHLFPRARSEILRLLFVRPEANFHLRDLSRHAGLTPAAVRKELANLSEGGLVLQRRDGNRLYFRANSQHPIYQDLRSVVTKTAGLALPLREALSSIENIRVAFIFGSLAAGTEQASSDVDLFIIGSAGLRQIAPALRGLASALNREINPHWLTPEEWKKKKRRGDAFVRRIAAEPKIWVKGGPHELAKLG